MGLDQEYIVNYQPISYLRFLLKFIEKLVALKMVWYLEANHDAEVPVWFQKGIFDRDICDTIETHRVTLLALWT